jgi:hypothetical protein
MKKPIPGCFLRKEKTWSFENTYFLKTDKNELIMGLYTY